MSEITTTHKGHSIRWSENEEVWRCHSIDFAHAKLSKVRQKIDRLDREVRKQNAVKATFVGGYNGECTPVTIVEAGNIQRERDYLSKGGDGYRHFREVWYVSEAGGRSKGKLSGFAPDTEYAREAIAAYQEAQERVREAQAEARRLQNAIPRLTEADIADLVGAAIPEEGAE